MLIPPVMLLVNSPLSLRGGGSPDLSGPGYVRLTDLADLAFLR